MYVLDTNIFKTLKNFPGSVFPSVWAVIDQLAESKQLLSVKEVRREIEFQDVGLYVAAWVKRNGRLFKCPTKAEARIVREILSHPRFQPLIPKKSIELGRPVADPFLIASAKARQGIVVTQEKKGIAGKIPDVCEFFGVQSLNMEEFFINEGLRL